MFNSFVILCVCFINHLTSESFVLHPAFHQSSNINGVSLDLQACRKSEISKPLQYTLTNKTIIHFDVVFFLFDSFKIYGLNFPLLPCTSPESFSKILFSDYSNVMHSQTSTNTHVQFCVSGDLMSVIQAIVLPVIKDVMPVCLFLVG